MPMPAIGSSRLNKPDSPTVSPRALATVSKSAGFFSFAGDIVGDPLRLGLRPLPLQLVLDLRPHFVERLRRRRFLVDHLDDVVAELRLDEIADLPRLSSRTPPCRTPAPSGPWGSKSRSPPFTLLRLVLRVLAWRAAAKSAPALTLASSSSACFFTAASSLPSVLSRMWLARTCSGVEYCCCCPCTSAGCPAGEIWIRVADRLHVDERVPDLALLGDLVARSCAPRSRSFTSASVAVEPVAELVGGERHDRELHLLVAALELLRRLPCR